MITRNDAKIISDNHKSGYLIYPVCVTNPRKRNELPVVVLEMKTPSRIVRGKIRFSQKTQQDDITKKYIELHRYIYDKRSHSI